jgi:hypothetical protein
MFKLTYIKFFRICIVSALLLVTLSVIYKNRPIPSAKPICDVANEFEMEAYHYDSKHKIPTHCEIEMFSIKDALARRDAWW